MIFIKLDSLETVTQLCKVSDKYKNKMDIDINFGRQTVDACSVLGVTSLMGNIVKVLLNSNDENLEKEYFNEIKQIGAYQI